MWTCTSGHNAFSLSHLLGMHVWCQGQTASLHGHGHEAEHVYVTLMEIWNGAVAEAAVLKSWLQVCGVANWEFWTGTTDFSMQWRELPLTQADCAGRFQNYKIQIVFSWFSSTGNPFFVACFTDSIGNVPPCDFRIFRPLSSLLRYTRAAKSISYHEKVEKVEER